MKYQIIQQSLQRSYTKRLFSALTQKDGITPITSAKNYIPRHERSTPIDMFSIDTSCDGRLVRYNRDDPSRDINFTPQAWQQHKSPWRRIRHIKTLWKSSPIQRLAMPDLTVTGMVAAILSYYNYNIGLEHQLHIDGSAMAGATTAVGLLAGFRLNASYGRYDEARKFWGEINNSSRDLAGNTMMWISCEKEQERMLKFIKTFPVALHWHLNYKGGHYHMKRDHDMFEQDRYADFYAEMKDVYENNENDADFQLICKEFLNGTHLPLRISAAMRSIIVKNHKYADPIYNREMDEQVQRLVGCLGMAERVLRTPIPVCFTRHTSRLFFFWSNSLPFALYPATGPLGTVPASLLISYSLLGIGDIGVQLEEPFNILPLRQYSEGIYDGVDNIRDSYRFQSNAINSAKNN